MGSVQGDVTAYSYSYNFVDAQAYVVGSGDAIVSRLDVTFAGKTYYSKAFDFTCKETKIPIVAKQIPVGGFRYLVPVYIAVIDLSVNLVGGADISLYYTLCRDDNLAKVDLVPEVTVAVSGMATTVVQAFWFSTINAGLKIDGNLNYRIDAQTTVGGSQKCTACASINAGHKEIGIVVKSFLQTVGEWVLYQYTIAALELKPITAAALKCFMITYI